MNNEKVKVVDKNGNVINEFDALLWDYHLPAIERLFGGIQPNMEFWEWTKLNKK